MIVFSCKVISLFKVLVILCLLYLLMFLLKPQQVKSQESYSTLTPEIIFTIGSIHDSANPHVLTRFSPWCNISYLVHYDYNEELGFFGGLGIKNYGFLTEYTDSIYRKKKYRAYCLTIPFGVKKSFFKDVEQNYMFFGGEFAFPVDFRYRETGYSDTLKLDFSMYSGGDKSSFPVNIALFSVYCGYTFSNNVTIKFQYCPVNFVNRKFYYENDGQSIQPFKNLKSSNLLMLSIGIAFEY